MKNKKETSPIAALCAAIGVFIATSVLTTFGISFFCAEEIAAGNYWVINIVQIVGSFTMFLIPALAVGRLVNGNTLAVFAAPNFSWRTIFVAIAAIVLVQPLVQWCSYINEWICSLPALGDFDLEAGREQNAQFLSDMIDVESPLGIIVSFVVIAIFPAICEELFFRGTLQNALGRACGSPVVTIIVSSAIFSLLHFEQTAFLPRLLLGAVLGTIYLLSGNLWLSIIAHAINNSTTLMMVWFLSDEQSIYDIFMLPNEDPGMIVTLISLTLTFFSFHTLQTILLKQKTKSDT